MGDGAIQFDDGRWRHLHEHIVIDRNPRPIRISSRSRSRMARGDGGLHQIGARAPELFAAANSGDASLDEDHVPFRTVLFEEENGFAVGPHARLGARGLNLH